MSFRIRSFGLCLLIGQSSFVVAEQTSVGPSADTGKQYVEVSVDQVVIDTQGLVAVSEDMARSIDTLALAIETLALQGSGLSAADKKVLLGAVQSVDRASVALAELAQELPQTVQSFGDRLPRVMNDARQPIAEMSLGLQSARDGIYAITAALPQATENAKAVVSASLDAVLLRLSIFSAVLFGLFALMLIVVGRYFYRAYFNPIATKLEALASAPEHFSAMSLHMRETSANLLALQNADRPDSQSANADESVPTDKSVSVDKSQ